VPTKENFLTNLPDDKEALKAMLRSLWQERERLEKRADEQQRKAEEQRQRADELYLEKLRLQLELERYKKATYGPRADRLSMNQLAQMLLEFAEALEQKPIQLEDLRPAEAEPELRRVKRRQGRRALANFENLPVNTYVYELSAEERTRLEQDLAKVTSKRIRASYTKDAAILGGAIARVGSTVYDGSVKGQLERMRQLLAASS